MLESLRHTDRKPKKSSKYPLLICIPAQSNTLNVHHVAPGERIYDLGSAQNWRAFMASQAFPYATLGFVHLIPCSSLLDTHRPYQWPKLNPSMIRRMRAAGRTELAD